MTTEQEELAINICHLNSILSIILQNLLNTLHSLSSAETAKETETLFCEAILSAKHICLYLAALAPEIEKLSLTSGRIFPPRRDTDFSDAALKCFRELDKSFQALEANGNEEKDPPVH